MFWHIFKKDWKLLWPFAFAVAAVEVAAVGARFQLAHFGGDRLLASFLVLLEMALYFGAGCLIAAIVHQEAIPGTRQDWLARPIKRRDLLMAKLLFVLLAVQVPLLLANFVESLALGFSFHQSFTAAGAQNLFLLAAFTLPIFAFVSLTKNLAEAVFGGFGVFVCVMAFELLNAGLHGGWALGPTANSGIDWIPETARYLMYIFGAAYILCLQYFRRKSLKSRWVLAGVALLCFFTEMIPWQPVYAVQRSLSPEAGAGKQIAIEFDPGLGRFQSPLPFDIQPDARRLRSPDEGGMPLYIPVRIEGLPADSVLKCDRATARVINDTSLETLTATNELNGDFEVHNDGVHKSAALTHEHLSIRGDVYNRLKDRPVRLEIDYSLTLLKFSGSHAIPALNGDRRASDLGWCKTRSNETEAAVEIRCLYPGRMPSHCASAFLENSITGRRDPDRFGCMDDYQPFFGRYKPVDAISHLGVNLPFRDPTGLAHYPVDASQLAQSRVVIRMYRAEDHFARRLVIPAIRLSDWVSR